MSTLTLSAGLTNTGAIAVTIDGKEITGKAGQFLRVSNDQIAVYVVVAGAAVNRLLDKMHASKDACAIEALFLEAGYPAHVDDPDDGETVCPLCNQGGLCAAAAACVAEDIAAASKVSAAQVAAWMIAEGINDDDRSITQLTRQFVEDMRSEEEIVDLLKRSGFSL